MIDLLLKYYYCKKKIRNNFLKMINFMMVNKKKNISLIKYKTKF